MKRYSIFLLVFLAAVCLRAQVVNSPGGSGLVVGATLPATCTVGQQYQVTTPGATYGNNVCTATNTWTLNGPGTSGPPSGSAGGVLSGTYPNPGLAASTPLTGTPTAPKPASGANSTQIATTNWVQQKLAALNPAVAVTAATTGALSNAPNYANGSSGVGATLTATSFGALAVDGVTLTSAQRVLVNNQAAALQNGIYTLTTVGNGSTDYILTRATDFNTPTAINNAGVIPVTSGTANNSTTWALDTAIVAIGTSAINYDQTNAQPPVVTTINTVPCTAGASCTITATPTQGTSTSVNGQTCALGGSCTISTGGTANENLRTIGAVLSPSSLTACIYVAFGGTINAFHAVVTDGATASTVLVKVETQPTFATFVSTGVAGASDISNGGEQLTSVNGLVDVTLTSWGTTLAAGTTVCFVGSGFTLGTSVNANITVAAN